MKWFGAVAIGVLALTVAWSLVTAGVYLLAGLPWALICSSVPLLVFSVVFFRGLSRV